MRGKNVGVVGIGAIGSLVCRILLVSPYLQQLLVFDHWNVLNTAADLRMHKDSKIVRQTAIQASKEYHAMCACICVVLFACLNASACKSLSWSHR